MKRIAGGILMAVLSPIALILLSIGIIGLHIKGESL